MFLFNLATYNINMERIGGLRNESTFYPNRILIIRYLELFRRSKEVENKQSKISTAVSNGVGCFRIIDFLLTSMILCEQKEG